MRTRGRTHGRTNRAGSNLREASLKASALAGVRLGGAILEGADLSCAGCRDADLGGARLAGALLAGADLARASLMAADLSRADLSGAVLDHARCGRRPKAPSVRHFLACRIACVVPVTSSVSGRTAGPLSVDPRGLPATATLQSAATEEVVGWRRRPTEYNLSRRAIFPRLPPPVEGPPSDTFCRSGLWRGIPGCPIPSPLPIASCKHAAVTKPQDGLGGHGLRQLSRDRLHRRHNGCRPARGRGLGPGARPLPLAAWILN